MVLPLRVWLHEDAGAVFSGQWAHTTDISHIGCRLGGLRTALLPGQTITLQRGKHKASFRVVWSNCLADNEHQAGIEALDYEKNIWGVDLPSSPFTPKQSISARTVTHKVVREPRPRLRWGLGLLVLGLALGASLYVTSRSESRDAAIRPPVPAAPSAAALAVPAPRPHPALLSLTKPVDPAMPLVKVAEVPTGRIVYPVAPAPGIVGQVRLQIIVAANGLVKQIHADSGRPILAQAAAQAVRLWHYTSLHEANALERETTVTISFLGPDAVSLQFPSEHGPLPSN